MQLNMTKEAILVLPENQQIFHREFTWLSKLAFAMGVFGGTLGCVTFGEKESCQNFSEFLLLVLSFK